MVQWFPADEFAAASPAAFAAWNPAQALALWLPDRLSVLFVVLLVLVFIGVFAALYARRRPGACPQCAARDGFVRQLLEREEGERKRVAQAIHDGLGHQLLMLKNAAAQIQHPPAAEAALREQLDSISNLAAQSLEQARGIAYRLRPFELDQFGLKAALEALVAEAFQGTDLRVFKDFDALPEEFTPAQKLHLFRLVQEGLNNVIHHAHASTVMLEIKRSGDRIHIQLEDDGGGFDVPAVRQNRRHSLGLARMQEHAKAISGVLELSSEPGCGTRIQIAIPSTKKDPKGVAAAPRVCPDATPLE